MGQREKKIEIS